MPLIIAIDGPSGVGKSTVGRKVAEHLGIPYLDTGAMYRAVGLLARRKGVALPIADAEAVRHLAEKADIRFAVTAGGARTLLNGEDVSAEIRTPEVSLYASAVSAIPAVRRRLVGIQRELALSGGGLLEGRDIGSKVVPETPFKFFLTATPEVRAMRRFRELQARGNTQSYEQVAAEMEARDKADASRKDSPLVCERGHIPVDTSDIGVEEVVAIILARVRQGASASG